MQEWKTWHQVGVENAGVENVAPDDGWKTQEWKTSGAYPEGPNRRH